MTGRESRPSTPTGTAPTNTLDVKILPAWAEFTPEQLGYLTCGYVQGWDAHAEQVQTWLGITREALRLPTSDDLARARTCDNRPCSLRCRRCSKCFRYEAAYRNRALYGSPDYPGVVRAAEILAQREQVAS